MTISVLVVVYEMLILNVSFIDGLFGVVRSFILNLIVLLVL